MSFGAESISLSTGKRGISPAHLLEQVRNTAAFALDPAFHPGLAYLEILRARARELDAPLPHSEYFRLCLSAHFTTVATYVPTDVDNQIRFKLWDPQLPLEETVAMARTVIEARAWNTRPVSARWVRASGSGEEIGGHLGEWFSVAAGAYGALRRKSPDLAAEIAGMIVREVDRHGSVYAEFRRARDGIGMLKTATLIAHNLGDLDRVLEMWFVPAEDPLMEAVFKSGHAEARTPRAELIHAGALNKAHMALENHRHFPLRPVRALRRSADMLLPIGPFFDDWGRRLARSPLLSLEEIAEVVVALVTGWERLGKTPDAPVPVGYPRALAGILEAFPGGMNALSRMIPARVERDLKAGPLRVLLSVSQSRFEETMSRTALGGSKTRV